jgi:hypothetical protein
MMILSAFLIAAPYHFLHVLREVVRAKAEPPLLA